MMSDYKGAVCYKIDVYAVKSDSWSSIQGTVNYSFRRGGNESYGVFFNGALHWLGSITTQKTSTEVIICFDIGSETMVNMPLPENIIPPIDYQGIMYANVGVWGDCISIIFIWGSVRIDVWVMQEYGVNKSWVKKPSATLLRWPGYVFPYWRPLWFYDSGEFLVDHCGEKFLLCDPAIGIISVPVCDITMENNRVSYVESISSLNSGKYMEKRITNGILKNPEPLQSR